MKYLFLCIVIDQGCVNPYDFATSCVLGFIETIEIEMVSIGPSINIQRFHSHVPCFQSNCSSLLRSRLNHDVIFDDARPVP